jgi:hypothetical protein
LRSATPGRSRALSARQRAGRRHHHGYVVSQLRHTSLWTRECAQLSCRAIVLTGPARFVLALLFVLVAAIVYGVLT